MTITRFPNGAIRASGVTFDPTELLWTATAEFQSCNDGQVSLSDFKFSDASLDADASGRFNEADVDAVMLLVGSTDPNHLDLGDLDDDGVLELYEVEELAASMQEAIECGLSAGLFGDFDQNRVVDCDDLAGARHHFGFLADQPEYRIELDFDLDGDTDQTDRIQFYGTFCPVDRNGDGNVDSSDISTFLAQWLADLNDGTTVADFDGSGTVNSGDISAFQSAWYLAVS